jgi:hypothetical protein
MFEHALSNACRRAAQGEILGKLSAEAMLVD